MKHVTAADLVAVVLASAAFFASAGAQAAVVMADIEFDPDDGTLTTNVGGMVHDSYVSGAIGFGSILVPGDTLRLNVSFVDTATGLEQTILLQQQGLGFPWPTTFGTVTNPGAHIFGPSLILGSNTTPASASAVVTPLLAAGSDPLSLDYTGGTGAATCALGLCSFPVIFPDLIEGNGEVSLSGFTVDFALGLAQTTNFSSVDFRLMAPGLSITQVPEPGTIALLLAAFAAAALSAPARRTYIRSRHAQP